MPQYKSIKVVPKIEINDHDTLSLVYTPGVGSSCLAIEKNPDSAMVYTNKINSVAVIANDYDKALNRAMFLKSSLLIDAYPLVVKECSKEDFRFALENLEINFCAFDLSLISDFVQDIDFSVNIPVLKNVVSDLRDFFGAISRNLFMFDVSKLEGTVAERSLQLHERAGGVVETLLCEQQRQKPVAIVSDGSAVLGYGNIGALASIPVMEGKAALYSDLADVDAFSFCVKTQNVDEIVKIVSMFESSFSGIHLEDVAAPRCFELETKLSDCINIPVFHDDQHGTAIIVLAGLLNALNLADKKLDSVKVVISGAGAAGNAIAKLLVFAGVKNLILSDKDGIVYAGRDVNDLYLEELAKITNPNKDKGCLKDIIKNADVFIGVSKPNILTKDMIKDMEYNPIIFALANPVPEIMPDEAKQSGAFVVATGRSDFENQINNALAFPGLFKGVIQAGVKQITNEIKLECALAIAEMVSQDELAPDNILPDALDCRLSMEISHVITEKFARNQH